MSKWVVGKWISDIHTNLLSHTGWELIGKFFAFSITIVGAVLALSSFISDRIENSIQRAETSYYSFLDNFGSEQRKKRIGSILQIPALMNKRVPIAGRGVFKAFNVTSSPIYKNDIKKILYDRIKSMDSTNAEWSKDEMNVLIATLLTINKSGWFDVKSKVTAAGMDESNDKNRFNWLWESSPQEQTDEMVLSNLFMGIKMDDYNFSKLNLVNPNFYQTSLRKSNFKYSIIHTGNFNEAIAEESTFEFGQLRNVSFRNAALSKSIFYRAEIANCNFNEQSDDRTAKTDLRNVSFQGSKIKHTLFQNIIMDNVKFVNSYLDSSFFNESSMLNSDFSNLISCNLINFNQCFLQGTSFANDCLAFANFRLANLSGASFKNCKIESCNFEGANLSSADFTNISLDTVSIWKDANIAFIKGLDKDKVRYLLSRGAVNIGDSKKWNKYKIDGRPNGKWRKYR